MICLCLCRLRRLTILALFLLNGLAATASAQQHHKDDGSTELADAILGIATNVSADLFAQLPDEVRENLIEHLKVEVPRATTPQQRAEVLLEAGHVFYQNGLLNRAFDLYDAVGNQKDAAADTRATALTSAGDIALVLDNNFVRSRVCFQRAVDLIDTVDPSEQDWNHGQAQLLALMRLSSSIYCTDMKSPELPEVYERILEFEPKYGDAMPDNFVAIGLDAARVMRAQGRPDDAGRYVETVGKHVDKAKGIPAEMLVKIKLNLLNKKDAWNDPDRIRSLLEIWEDRRFAEQSEIMKVGNEILWARFLERQAQRNEFEQFADDFVKRGEGLLASKSSGDQVKDEISVYSAQAIAIMALSRYETGRQRHVPELKNRYQELREGKPLIGRFPAAASNEQLQNMSDGLEKALGNVFQIDPLR